MPPGRSAGHGCGAVTVHTVEGTLSSILEVGGCFSEEGILDLGSESEACHADEMRKAEGVECAEISEKTWDIWEIAETRQSLRDKGEGQRQGWRGRQEGGCVISLRSTGLVR